MGDVLKNFAIFMLIFQCFGNITLAGMLSPAFQALLRVVTPTTVQQSIGNIIAYGMLAVGVYLFRLYFRNMNWRYTLGWTNMFNVFTTAINFPVINNWGGWGQNAWFFVIGTNAPQLVVGIGQVLTSLAVVEVSPSGLEATVYEIITTMNNAAITMCNLLTAKLIAPFDLDQISGPHALDIYHSRQSYWNDQMNKSNYLTMGIIFCATCTFVWCFPRSREQCQEWKAVEGFWRTWPVGLLNVVLVLGLDVYSIWGTLSTLVTGSA